MNTLNIEEEKVRNTYQKASDEQKKVLEQLFGVDTFKPKCVMDRIKTFDDALKELGPNHHLVKEYEVIKNSKITYSTKLYSKLSIITAALNEGWIPQFVKGELRYFPYFGLYTKEEIEENISEEKSHVIYRSSAYKNAFKGLFYVGTNKDSNFTYTSCPRFAFKTEELAEYAGKQFTQLYADYLF